MTRRETTGPVPHDGLRRDSLRRTTIIFILCLLGAMAVSEVSARDTTREQMKGLDEQVQEIKSDVLSIAADLNGLEERLLYPSNTQVAVFVDLADGEDFRLDSVQIQLNGDLAQWVQSKGWDVHVSVTDESDYAASFVVVERKH